MTTATQRPADAIAGRVYTLRKRSLVPPIAILPAIFGVALLSSGMGFVASGSHMAPARASVESISPDDVQTIWEKQVKPLRGNEFHLTLDLDNTLRASDSRTDKNLWTLPLPEIAPTSAPLVFTDNDKILVSVATSIGAVYLINAQSGQVLWMQNVSDQVDVSPLQIKNSMLVVACADGKVYGLNAADGHIDYMIQTDSEITALEPVADGRGEHIYAIADKTRVMALNAMTGDLQWRRETSGVATDSPILTARNIITPTADGNSSKLWAFDANGNLSWMNTFARYTSLAATERYIAMAQGSVITLIKAETGEAVHYWQLNGTPTAIEVSEKNGQLVVKTDQGNLTSAVN
ncbi:MAG: PQQ-binding-like beta-propeller repeat protein [Turneriella sp.]